MRFSRGFTPELLDRAIAAANAKHGYQLHAEYAGSTKSSFNARLVPDSSRSHGARWTAPKPWQKSRRLKAACWHAHRDVLAELFDLLPTGRVQSAFADYQGRAAFELAFPQTSSGRRPGAEYSIFSQSPMMPVRFCDLCDCA